MQTTNCLISLVIVLFWSQNAELKKLPPDVGTFDFFIDNSSSKELVQFGNRNIKDVWNNIKKSIVNAWDALKKLATNSKKKVNIWMENVKVRAQEVIKSFENRMNHLKEEIQEIIQHVFDETEIVKGCLQKEKESIENIIKKLIQDLTLCISRSMKNITLLNSDIITLNDTYFYEELENKYTMCKQDVDSTEECLNQVREYYYNDIEHMETNVYEYRTVSRNLADDLLESLISCSIDVVIEASPILITETLRIIKCVVESSKL